MGFTWSIHANRTKKDKKEAIRLRDRTVFLKHTHTEKKRQQANSSIYADNSIFQFVPIRSPFNFAFL